LQASRQLEDFSGGEVLQVLVVQLGKRPGGFVRIVNQSPNQRLFRMFQLPERGQLPGCDLRPLLHRSLPDFRADYLFCNSRLVREAVGELIARRRIRNRRRHSEHPAEKLSPIVIVLQIQLRCRPIE